MIDPVMVIVVKKPADNLVPFFNTQFLLTILELVALNFFDCYFRISSFKTQISFQGVVQNLKFGTLIIIQAMRLSDPGLCFYSELRHVLVFEVADRLINSRLSCTHY